MNWLEPGDLDFGAMSFQIIGLVGNSVSSQHVVKAEWWWESDVACAHAMATDGTVLRLTPDAPPETVKSLLLRADGK